MDDNEARLRLVTATALERAPLPTKMGDPITMAVAIDHALRLYANLTSDDYARGLDRPARDRLAHALGFDNFEDWLNAGERLTLDAGAYEADSPKNETYAASVTDLWDNREGK